MESNETSGRRYDIDWLRVMALGLLLIYHAAVVFHPGTWVQKIFFIQSEKSWEMFWIPMEMLNVWRIPLLFMICGIGVGFAIKKRNWKQLLRERTRRILVPFLFGVVCIGPLQIGLFQYFHNKPLVYLPNPAHLWFLLNIWVYTAGLIPLLCYLNRNPNNTCYKLIRVLLSNPLGIYTFIFPLVVLVMLTRPTYYTVWFAPSGFFFGMLTFFVGYCFVAAGDLFWRAVRQTRYVSLIAGVSLFLFRWLSCQFQAPIHVLPVETMCWLFTVIGFSCIHLNRPSRILSYCTEAVFPMYILHMLILNIALMVVLPLALPVQLKLLLSIILTGLVGWLLYEVIFRRIPFSWIRLLFGLNSRNARI